MLNPRLLLFVCEAGIVGGWKLEVRGWKLGFPSRFVRKFNGNLGSTKFQAPISKQIPSTKFKIQNGLEFWSLEF
jgi:hypothetical protein